MRRVNDTMLLVFIYPGEPILVFSTVSVFASTKTFNEMESDVKRYGSSPFRRNEFYLRQNGEVLFCLFFVLG
jgi:hypothetical protein